MAHVAQISKKRKVSKGATFTSAIDGWIDSLARNTADGWILHQDGWMQKVDS